MTVNQTSITGPNSRAIRSVPPRCTQNSAKTMSSVSGTTKRWNEGWIRVSPSTADRTEIAGVIIESPKNSDTPTIPTTISSIRRRG